MIDLAFNEPKNILVSIPHTFQSRPSRFFSTQFQPAVYDGVEGADRSCIKSCDYKICSIRKIEIGDLKTELNSAIDIEGTHFKLTYNSRIKNNVTRYIRIKVLGDGDDKTKAH